MLCVVFWLMYVFACPVGAVPASNSETSDYEDVTIMTSPTQPQNMNNTEQYLDEMNDIALYWYTVIRNYIAVPLMILSFASCGYKFFMCAIMTKPEYAIDETKKQFLNTIILMFVLFAIPMIMTIVRNITEASKWTPPQ